MRWIKQEDIILSETSQTEKCHIILFICGILKKRMKSQTHKQKVEWWLLETGEWGDRGHINHPLFLERFFVPCSPNYFTSYPSDHSSLSAIFFCLYLVSLRILSQVLFSSHFIQYPWVILTSSTDSLSIHKIKYQAHAHKKACCPSPTTLTPEMRIPAYNVTHRGPKLNLSSSPSKPVHLPVAPVFLNGGTTIHFIAQVRNLHIVRYSFSLAAHIQSITIH